MLLRPSSYLGQRLGSMLGDAAAIKVRWWSERQRVLAVCKAHRAPRSDLARESQKLLWGSGPIRKT